MSFLKLESVGNVAHKYKFKEATVESYSIETGEGVVVRSTSFSTPDEYRNSGIHNARNVQIPPISKLLIVNTCCFKPIHRWISVESTNKASEVICNSTDKNETILLLGICCPLSNNHLWRLRRLVAPRKVIGESLGYKDMKEPLKYIENKVDENGIVTLSPFWSLILRLQSRGHLETVDDFRVQLSEYSRRKAMLPIFLQKKVD